jgi:surface antigen
LSSHPSVFAILLSATLLAGCQGAPGRDETAGLIAGAAGGLLIGTGIGSIAALAIGAVAGAVAGDRIGYELDERDRARAARAERHAVTVGKPTVWHNPASHHAGTVRPAPRRFVDGQGRSCRRFSHVVIIDGREETASGIGCRNPDGQWVLSEGPLQSGSSTPPGVDR